MESKLVVVNGEKYDFEVLVDYMNDEIRESLNSRLAPCSEQEFIDAYLNEDEDFMERYSNDLFPVED